MHTLFENEGLQITGPTALQNMTKGNDSSLFSYGDFYLTASREKAARYAGRNTWGSEQLAVINAAIKGLVKLEPDKIQSILNQRPNLAKILEMTFEPIVLEFSGLSLADHKIFKENGTAIVPEHLDTFLENGISIRMKIVPIDNFEAAWKIGWDARYDPKRDSLMEENDFSFEKIELTEIMRHSNGI